MIRLMHITAIEVAEAITETAEPVRTFWEIESPLWISLLALAVAGVAAFATWLATRNAGLLSAPDIQIEIDETYTQYGARVPVRVTNKGHSTALNVRITWDYDPAWTRISELAWSISQLRPGESFTADIAMLSPFDPKEGMLWEHYSDLIQNSRREDLRYGTLRYKKQLAFFRETKARVTLPTRIPPLS